METVEIRDLSYSKSTNGRSLKQCEPVLRRGFGCLARAWPSGAERLAAWLFCHPMRARVAADEAAVLEQGHAFRLDACGYDLPAWSWGDGPTVLLHHGWSGRAAHMAGLVRPLLDAGFSVVAYDAPAHGAAPGRITAAPEMARVLREVAFRLNGLHGVVAHSVGGAATLLAVRNGLKLQGAVLLAPPSEMRGFVELFGDHLGLDDEARRGMARRAASWFGIEWKEMDVEHWAGSARPPLLVVHDRNDRVVPWAHGARVAQVWGNAELHSTTGLGHSGVRSDPDVMERVVGFLSESNRP